MMTLKLQREQSCGEGVRLQHGRVRKRGFAFVLASVLCLAPLAGQFHGNSSRTYRFCYIQDYDMPFVSGLATQQRHTAQGKCQGQRFRDQNRKFQKRLSEDIFYRLLSFDGAKAEAVELNIAYTEQNFIKTRSAAAMDLQFCHGFTPIPRYGISRLPQGLVGSQNLLRVAGGQAKTRPTNSVTG